MRSYVFVRQYLTGSCLSRKNSDLIRRSSPNELFSSVDSQRRFAYYTPLSNRWRSLEPWTITKDELADPKKLSASVRRGIWEGLSGGMSRGFWVRVRQSPANQASRQTLDKRGRLDKENEKKRRKIENGEEVRAPIYATQFSKEDIENEQRRPKKKVAVLLGYSGTGYKGMQLYGHCLVLSAPDRY
jgi:tRNA pseudouridine38-40 synthase